MVQTLRAFLAVAPPHEVRHALVDQLRELDVPGRLVPAANLHLTLRFLGDVDQVALDRFSASIDQAERGDSFIVSLTGLGSFPNPRKATVVWARVGKGGQALYELAEIAESGATASGLTAEERPFAPHLTISRVRPPRDVVGLVNDTELDISWRVSELVLFESVMKKGSVSYEPLEVFPLIR